MSLFYTTNINDESVYHMSNNNYFGIADGNFSYKKEPFLTFEVWNKNVMADAKIGSATVSLKSTIPRGKKNSRVLTLQLKNRGSNDCAGILSASFYILTPEDAKVIETITFSLPQQLKTVATGSSQ